MRCPGDLKFCEEGFGGSSVINETIVSAKWWETSQNLEIQSDITLKREDQGFNFLGYAIPWI